MQRQGASVNPKLGLAVAGESIEERVRQRTAQLEAANADLMSAIASLREFVAVAAHDLRNVKAALETVAGLIVSAPDEASRTSLLACLERETAHLGRLIEDLFVLSLADAGRLDVHPATLELEPILQAAAAEISGSDVEVQGATGLLVQADPCHVRRIVANLLRNSVQHGAPPIRIAAAADQEHVEIRVSDAGPGVPEDFVPRLFLRFTRAAGTDRGAGLGLSIVAELARLNGGAAYYLSDPDRAVGATFAVRLPAPTTAGESDN
jgi:two-component system, OmpR family, sensor histidine kinase MtrB